MLLHHHQLCLVQCDGNTPGNGMAVRLHATCWTKILMKWTKKQVYVNWKWHTTDCFFFKFIQQDINLSSLDKNKPDWRHRHRMFFTIHQPTSFFDRLIELNFLNFWLIWLLSSIKNVFNERDVATHNFSSSNIILKHFNNPTPCPLNSSKQPSDNCQAPASSTLPLKK